MQEKAKQFAEMLVSFVEVANRVKETDDAEKAFAEADQRLRNKQLELETALKEVAKAREESLGIVAKAHEDAEMIFRDATEKRDAIIEEGQKNARQLVVNATGDAEAKMKKLLADIETATQRKDTLQEETDGLVHMRERVRADLEASGAELKKIKDAILELKARL